jgi:SAM-dependent methyltransferase
MNLRQLGARYLPRAIKRRLRSLDRIGGQRYRQMSFSDAELAEGAYKRYLGGGAESWDSRGAFQLRLLQSLGMQPAHTLLDIGCGPLRAGVHLIDFLEPGHYAGMDYNPDFIRAAEHVVRSSGLDHKRPKLLAIDDFRFEEFGASFDYALAFSVLNNCNSHLKQTCLRRLGPVLAPGGRAFITHARWFDESYLRGLPLALGDVLKPDSGPLQGLAIDAWGWDHPEEIFPILELVKR